MPCTLFDLTLMKALGWANPVSFTISSQFEEFYEEGVAMPNNVMSFHFEQSFALVNTTGQNLGKRFATVPLKRRQV